MERKHGKGFERHRLSGPPFVLAILAWAVCACALGHLAQPARAAVVRSGKLQATVTDFRSGESTTRYRLRSGKREIALRPTKLAAEPGDRVIVTGEFHGDRLVGAVRGTDRNAQAQAISPGPRKAAVVLFAFSGEAAEPWSAGESRSEVFTAADSVSAFYEEESYGDISLTGSCAPTGTCMAGSASMRRRPVVNTKPGVLPPTKQLPTPGSISAAISTSFTSFRTRAAVRRCSAWRVATGR